MHISSHSRYSESSRMQQHAAEDPGPLGKRHHRKSQSAMEYLMTYGWSILIIAVVLGALAYLGVFNPLYFAPKANPGSCQAFRPNGAGTSYGINLLGVCNGEIPEYVAQFNGCSGCGIQNYPYSWINIPSVQLPQVPSYITVSAWIDPTNSQCDQPIFTAYDDAGGFGFGLILVNLDPRFYISNGEYVSSFPINTNQWTFITATYTYVNSASSNMVIYVNHGPPVEAIASNIISLNNIDPEMAISLDQITYTCPGSQSHFSGYITNIQMYNTSLDYASVNALYQEGIGGAPIDLQNLIGWWPLNGNANDYSGNGNNGVPTNVVYTSSWISNYNPP